MPRKKKDIDASATKHAFVPGIIKNRLTVCADCGKKQSDPLHDTYQGDDNG